VLVLFQLALLGLLELTKPYSPRSARLTPRVSSRIASPAVMTQSDMRSITRPRTFVRVRRCLVSPPSGIEFTWILSRWRRCPQLIRASLSFDIAQVMPYYLERIFLNRPLLQFGGEQRSRLSVALRPPIRFPDGGCTLQLHSPAI
jgi:hypothetical protein